MVNEITFSEKYYIAKKSIIDKFDIDIEKTEISINKEIYYIFKAKINDCIFINKEIHKMGLGNFNYPHELLYVKVYDRQIIDTLYLLNEGMYNIESVITKIYGNVGKYNHKHIGDILYTISKTIGTDIFSFISMYEKDINNRILDIMETCLNIIKHKNIFKIKEESLRLSGFVKQLENKILNL